jgi:hypothetical protein
MSTNFLSGVLAAVTVQPEPPLLSTAEATGLLPEPQPINSSVIDDAMSGLYEVQLKLRQFDLVAGKDQVVIQQAREKKATDDLQDAIKKQQEADQHHSFWDSLEHAALDVAKVATTVGSLAAAVATAGAGTPLVVASTLALSVGSTVVSETKCLGAASQWVALGMGLAGAGVGAIGALSTTALSSGTLKALGEVGTGATALAGGATAAAGGAHVESGEFAAEAQEAAADAENDKTTADRENEAAKFTIDHTSEQDEGHRQTLQTIQGVIQTNDRTNADIASARS